MQAEILTYSRARGVFAGVSLQGATLRPDSESNLELYGRSGQTNRDIVMGNATAPEAASALIAELNKMSRTEK
jgi:lipid-binding SYLF domain-containing protein